MPPGDSSETATPEPSSHSSTWIIAVLGMGFAFIFAGLAYFAKKHFWDSNGGKGRKFFSRETYEFSALQQSSDATNIGEDSVPLTTSRDLSDAFGFGDSSDEERDYPETTQVVFENPYMDKYMNDDEKVEIETVNEKSVEYRDIASGSGGEDLIQGESINNSS